MGFRLTKLRLRWSTFWGFSQPCSRARGISISLRAFRRVQLHALKKSVYFLGRWTLSDSPLFPLSPQPALISEFPNPQAGARSRQTSLAVSSSLYFFRSFQWFQGAKSFQDPFWSIYLSLLNLFISECSFPTLFSFPSKQSSWPPSSAFLSRASKSSEAPVFPVVFCGRRFWQ